MTVWDWLIVIAIIIATRVAERLGARLGDLIAKPYTYLSRLSFARYVHRARRRQLATQAEEGTPETLRCGYHIRRGGGMHGPGLVRVRDSETTFYLDAALFDRIDDDTFMALAAAGGKMEALPTASGSQARPLDAEAGDEATADAWAAFNALQRRMQGGGDAAPSGVAFAFEAETSHTP